MAHSVRDLPAALWIVPTRGRPAELARFLAAYAGTVRADSRLLIAADDDDRDAYAGITLPPGGTWARAPRMNTAPKVNRYALPAAAAGVPVIGFLGNDTVPVTPGWDALLLAALDTPGVACPWNGIRPDSGAGEHFAVSSVIIRALGWFFPWFLEHYWSDVVIGDIAVELGVHRFVRAARVDHFHFQHHGATARDEVYDHAGALAPADHAAYERWRYGPGYGADVAAVRAAVSQDRAG